MTSGRGRGGGGGIVKSIYLPCEHLFYSEFFARKSKNDDMPQYSTSTGNTDFRNKWKIGANGHFFHFLLEQMDFLA